MSETKLVNLEVLKQKVSSEIFESFCLEANVCPSCFGELTISRDRLHEVVCRKCGLVIAEEPARRHNLPGHGSSTNYNDTCSLAFGKSLGSHIGRYKMYSILKKAPQGVKDLGIRALMVKNATKIEIPQIQRMLSYGSECCKRYGLAGKDNKSVVFADGLGRVLRISGLTALTLSRGSISSKRLSYACFCWLYRKTFHDGNNVQEELKVKPEHLAWIDRVMGDVSLPRTVEIYGKNKAVKDLFDDEKLDCQCQINPDWPEKGPLILSTKREEPVWECSPDLPVLKFVPKKNNSED